MSLYFFPPPSPLLTSKPLSPYSCLPKGLPTIIFIPTPTYFHNIARVLFFFHNVNLTRSVHFLNFFSGDTLSIRQDLDSEMAHRPYGLGFLQHHPAFALCFLVSPAHHELSSLGPLHSSLFSSLTILEIQVLVPQ